MRDGVLNVIDFEFYDNEAALEGPDVGGGAIYVQGAKRRHHHGQSIPRQSRGQRRCHRHAVRNPAVFRTPNVAVRQMVIDRTVFDGNTARLGGVSFIKQNDLKVKDSLLPTIAAASTSPGERSLVVRGACG